MRVEGIDRAVKRITNRYPKDRQPTLHFVSDSQDVQPVKEYVGKKAQDFDSFFVVIHDGDYVAVYGIQGIVPWLYKPVTRLL